MRGRIAAPLLLAALSAGCGGLGTSEYTSADGRDRVQFAGEPKLNDKSLPVLGTVVVARTAIHEDWLGTARVVMYVDYPDRMMQSYNIEAGLEGACQGMARECNSRCGARSRSRSSDIPARGELRFAAGAPGGEGHGQGGIFLVGHRLYQVFIAGKSGVIGTDTIDEFLRSFKLTDQASAAPAETQVAGGSPPVAAPSPIADRPSAPRPGRPSSPGLTPAAGGDMLAFYEIPDPPSAAIEADVPNGPPSPLLFPAGPEERAARRAAQSPFRRKQPARPDPRPEPAPRPSPPAPGPEEIPTQLTPEAGGATILGFNWVGRDDDYTGTNGREIAPGGGQDEHFRLAIDLPAAVIVEEIAILGGPVRWTTRPTVRSWPLAVVSNQQLKNLRQSTRLARSPADGTSTCMPSRTRESSPGSRSASRSCSRSAAPGIA